MGEYNITGNEIGFIFQNWDTIGYAMIGLAIIAMIVVILSKESVARKIAHIFFICILPPLGTLYVFGRELYKKLKARRVNQPA